MAFCPFAEQMLLPESASQPSIVPRLVILHSTAGRGSLYNFFRTGSNLESHFWVSEDGAIEQYMDTNVRADANLEANSFAVSIETESTRAATERWGPAQAAAIVRLVGWICDEHRIPKRLVPTWDGSGIGWHVQFGAPGPWTPVAKSCPGPARIIQARNEIIPAVAKATPANPTKDWFDMSTEADREEVRTIVAGEVNRAIGAIWTAEAAAVKRHQAIRVLFGSIRGWSAAAAEKLYGDDLGQARDRAVELDNSPKK